MSATSSRLTAVSLVCLSILLSAGPAMARDGYWWGGFGPAGVAGGIYSMTEHFEDLYVGGLFDVAGGVAAANIARFNGQHWLDVDEGTDGRVLGVFSTATTIIIGGNFWNAGGSPCEHVADLELGEWTPMGDGLPDWPNVFTMHNAALHAGGKLDADGDLNYSMVARFDGLNWHDEIEGGGSYNWVNEAHDIVHYDGELFIGGDFTYDLFDPDIHCFTSWDGSEFHDYGFFNGEIVNSLLVHDKSLYIGGELNLTGGTGSYGLATLMGAGNEIHPVAQADVPRIVVDLVEWHQVVAVGQRDAVIPFNGISWLDTLGGVLAGQLNALAVIGVDLYAAGGFPGAIARWDDNWDEWVGVGGSPGVANHELNTMHALCVHDGFLVAAGDFSLPTILEGRRNCENVGIWDDGAWHRAGCGLNATVYDLAVHGGDMIAAGHFETAGGAVALHLARWDGAAWGALGDPDGDVFTLAIWNGQLVAGGDFHNVGGVSADRIARWDGAAWHAFGSGLSSTVRDLTVLDGELYAGGAFTSSGGTTLNYVARWDGSQWQPLGAGVGAIVYAVGHFQGDLIAGGWFTAAGGAPAERIARFDGSAWHPLGAGLGGASILYGVKALLEVGGELFVGGDFAEAGGLPVTDLAVWNGSAWSEFAGGVTGGASYSCVHDLMVHEGDLYVAGHFTSAGGRGEDSYHLARWVDGTLTPTFLQTFDLAVEAGSVTARWQVGEPVAADAFVLTGEATGRTWTVPHVVESAGSFRADDHAPPAGAGGEVSYTLRYAGPTGPTAVLAQQTVTLELPLAVRLLGAQPNPFNPGATVAFELDRPETIRLDVYDTAGRRIARLAGGPHQAGRHEVRWDGRDGRGHAVASGTYVARLVTGRNVQARKLLLVR
ncbi:MAG: FlgD immunoglobulin-like domain containing protein [bacterium]